MAFVHQSSLFHELSNVVCLLILARIGRGRGRGQPRRATGGPGMTAPPSVTTTPGLGRGIYAT